MVNEQNSLNVEIENMPQKLSSASFSDDTIKHK